MKICFDMDGTIANLYGVEGWLDDLINENTRPYEMAHVMLNMNILARRLNQLQNKGYELVIISWLSKNSSTAYDEAVTTAKLAWLKKHLNSVHWNEIHIVRYGTNKAQFASSDEDILFDDEDNNRANWIGQAYDVTNILEILKNL